MVPRLARPIEQLVLFSTAPVESAAFVQACVPTLAPGATTEQFASVRFVACTEASDERSGGLSNFWKFTVFTDDIETLRSSIQASGREVSEAQQFGDIGYLCHFAEPGGNEIELLQRTFAGRPPPSPPRSDGLGLITLRVQDRQASSEFYRQTLGMTELCEMAVDDGRPDPFDLYFFGSTEDEPPDPDRSHVNNREWLYQRPYTIIELQHYRSADVTLRQKSGDRAGLSEVLLAGPPLEETSPDGHSFASTAS